MKKKVQHLLTAIGFTVVLAAALLACSEFLEYKEAKEKYSDFYEAETNFDVIFMGTSHAYGTVFPMELWQEYGISSYNWGYNHCALPESYHLMLEVVKRTKPKLFVVDLYGIVEYENWDGIGNGKYRTDKVEEQHVPFDAVPLSRDKVTAIRDIFDDYDKRADFLWNFILYHNRWEDLGERDFTAQALPLKGATIYAGVGTHPPYKPTETETVEVDSVAYDYLIKMLEFCSQNDIRLLCTYLPYPAKTNVQKIANSVGEVINSYPGCHYLNMLDNDYITYPADIYTDNHHLNYMGAYKATSWLGAYIMEHFGIESHFDDAEYAQVWNADYQSYKDYKIDLLKDLTGFYDQLLLTYGPDLTAQVQVAADCAAFAKDTMAAAILAQIPKVSVSQQETVPYKNNSTCDLLLTIYRADDGSIVRSCGFTYKDGVPVMAE